MEGIAFLLFAAAFAYGVAHLFNVPVIPALLVTGIVLAVSDTLPVELLEDTLVLGTTMLLFVAGMELNPKRTRAQRDAAIKVGTFQFFALAAVGLLSALALGYALVHAAYMALALTASSTLVVLRLLQRRGQLFEPFGRLVLGVLLLQDLFVLLLIPLVMDIPQGPGALLINVVAMAAMVGLATLVFRYAAPWMEQFDQEEEILLLLLLAVLFVFVGMSDFLGLPLITGAFLAGVALSRFPLSGMARTHLGSISEFFSALFFIALGALIGIPSALELVHALALTLVVVLVTPPLVTVITERAGMSSRAAIESGLLLAQTSEISLVLGLLGLIAGQITETVFTVIAIVTLLTMLLTPWMTTYRVADWLMRHRPSGVTPQRRSVDRDRPRSGHVLVLGSGSTGMPILETLLASGADILVIDDDPVVIDRLRDAEISCMRGDASDPELLREAGADRARIITSTIRRPRDNQRLLEVARGVPTLVRVFDEDDADWIRELGGTPILASHAAADEVLRWFDRTFSSGA